MTRTLAELRETGTLEDKEITSTGKEKVGPVPQTAERAVSMKSWQSVLPVLGDNLSATVLPYLHSICA